MPIIRFRNPDGDPLDFVDVFDRPEVRRIWEERGWVGEVLPEENPVNEGLVAALEEQQEIQARQVWDEVVRRVERAAGAALPEPLPMPDDWPPRNLWENWPIGHQFVWAGDRFQVVEDADGNRDVGRIIDPGQINPRGPRLGERIPLPQWARAPVLGEAFGRSEKAKGKTGEDLFRLILSGIREVYDVEAVIAGGAVRDLVVGDTEGTKDIDVFIPMKWEDFDKNSDELGWQGKPGLLRKKPYKTTVSKTSSARAAGVVQGMAVDLVFMDGGLTPQGVDGFPVNAQKCVWNLQEGLVVSPAARADIEGKKFTISPALTDKEAIKTVRDKVQSWLKRPCYKGWKVVEPETKEWWQKQNDPHTVERGKKEKKEILDDLVWKGWL